ncbi:MAG: phenylalanine--tRNA ligase subunit beta [Thermoleophilaceae bacterium]|nr:phenylalanine--tRNA ligase subunit beta [Thermoleophilaceae bacterium]
MRVPLSWLRSYCDPGLSAEELAERLNMTGTEVVRVERVGVGDPARFVVGKVLSAERHPNADRLRVCEVDAGDGPRTIVCGAPNVAAGQTVAVALPGAVMPDGQALGEATLRGVRSSGMILAEDEVGIGGDHAGIMVLPDELPPGAPLAEHLPIADEVLEAEITPNRPDCLGVYGIAREVHAVTGAELAPDPTLEDAQPAGDDDVQQHVSIEIDPEVCLRFTARAFEGVRIGPSPLWLKQRLMAAGQRPISNVVDVTNYVMLLTGQPLHAFDLDAVRGGRISVRRAEPGERLTTLDGVERELDPSMAVICDAEGTTSLAGIMGGQVSEVSDGTTRVLMEAATWVGRNILETSKRLGLRSEASARFEKQLHPDQAAAAQRLAARLMVEICGARLVPGTIDLYPSPLPERVVRLRHARVRKLLGEDIPEQEIVRILVSLGFEVQPSSAADGVAWEVTVPGFRDSDVQREADLIEEVARVYGLEKLPTTLPARKGGAAALTRAQRVRRRAEDALRDRGLSEIVAWSFTSPAALERARLGDVPVLRLENPLSEEQSVMRPLLLPGLLDSARHNTARGRPGLALFESAHVYRPSGPLTGVHDESGRVPRGAVPASERHHIGAVMTEAVPGSWRRAPEPADFFAVKGVLAGVLDSLRVEWRVEPAERPFLHPGRAASVVAGADERKLGWVGELHPLVARAWDLERVAAFEIDADLLAELVPERLRHRETGAFPAVVQDLAVVVAEDVPADQVRAAVAAGGGELLERIEVFDVYRGEQVGPGRKSLALRLEFRAPDRTLTDAEVAERRAAIERELAPIGGRLRG